MSLFDLQNKEQKLRQLEEVLDGKRAFLANTDRELRGRLEVLEKTETEYRKFNDFREELGKKKIDLQTSMLETEIKLAKMEAEATHKKELLTIEEAKNAKELSMMKEVHKIIVAEKEKTIELLKEQVEVLTAKLVEIKIDGVNLNVVSGGKK